MIKALNDHVVLEVILPEDKTTNAGLILPKQYQTVDPYGLVVALSKSAKENTELELGDKVILHATQVLQKNEIGGKHLLFISYKALLGVFGEEENEQGK